MRSYRASLAAMFATMCAAFFHGGAAAQHPEAFRVDDSGTVVSVPLLQMRWRQPVPGRIAMNEVDGELDVALRLNLMPWLRRDLRLYLVLEPFPLPGTTLTARWRESGLLQGGSVRSGGRALVFQGRVNDAVLQEKLHFALTTDGTQLTATQAVQFHIEAEIR